MILCVVCARTMGLDVPSEAYVNELDHDLIGLISLKPVCQQHLEEWLSNNPEPYRFPIFYPSDEYIQKYLEVQEKLEDLT